MSLLATTWVGFGVWRPYQVPSLARFFSGCFPMQCVWSMLPVSHHWARLLDHQEHTRVSHLTPHWQNISFRAVLGTEDAALPTLGLPRAPWSLCGNTSPNLFPNPPCNHYAHQAKHYLPRAQACRGRGAGFCLSLHVFERTCQGAGCNGRLRRAGCVFPAPNRFVGRIDSSSARDFQAEAERENEEGGVGGETAWGV